MGANDGILLTNSLVISVAAASYTRSPIVLAAVAGVMAGGLSMAAGKYVSVGSHTDIEKADLAMEENELGIIPGEELTELAMIYKGKGLGSLFTTRYVEKQLMAHNALEAHARDKSGINEMTHARLFQAALALAASFITGELLPLLVSQFLTVLSKFLNIKKPGKIVLDTNLVLRLLKMLGYQFIPQQNKDRFLSQKSLCQYWFFPQFWQGFPAVLFR